MTVTKENIAEQMVCHHDGVYGKSCISSYSKKIIMFRCVRTNKNIFLINGTVRTNKMKF